MVAGVLAATMSTLDSTINALCATLYNDILPKVEGVFHHLRNTALISLGLWMVALVASQYNGMLMLGLKIQSWTGGSLLGIFLCTVIFKRYAIARLDWPSVMLAYLSGTLLVGLNTFWLEWDWNFNVYLGCLGSMIGMITWSQSTFANTIQDNK